MSRNIIDDYAERFVNKYGHQKQMQKGIEECAEVIQATSKVISSPTGGNVKSLCGEIIDLKMMLTQLEYIVSEVYGAADAYEETLEEKLVQWQGHFDNVG